MSARLVLAALGLVLTAGCTQSNEPPVHPGQRVWIVRCSKCHGANGDAQGVVMANHGKPRSFLRDEFKTAAKPGGLPTDEMLRQVIRTGFPGRNMPPFTFLSPKEVDDLIAFIKSDIFARRAMRQAAMK